jgi:hypothetical protein
MMDQTRTSASSHDGGAASAGNGARPPDASQHERDPDLAGNHASPKHRGRLAVIGLRLPRPLPNAVPAPEAGDGDHTCNTELTSNWV